MPPAILLYFPQILPQPTAQAAWTDDFYTVALADVHSGYLYSNVRTPLPHGISKLLFKYVSNILYSFQDIFFGIHCAILEEI